MMNSKMQDVLKDNFMKGCKAGCFAATIFWVEDGEDKVVTGFFPFSDDAFDYIEWNRMKLKKKGIPCESFFEKTPFPPK